MKKSPNRSWYIFLLSADKAPEIAKTPVPTKSIIYQTVIEVMYSSTETRLIELDNYGQKKAENPAFLGPLKPTVANKSVIRPV
jgi:hypothetical protein